MDDKPTMDPKTICLEDLGKIIEQGSYTTSTIDYESVDWASKNRNLEIVKYLVAQGADIHAKNDFLLKWATEKGHLDVVEYLKEQGASLGSK